MKIEQIFYRLSILLIITSMLGGGALSIYSHFEANDWDKLVKSSYKDMNKGYVHCETNPNSVACEFIPSRKESFDTSVEMRGYYQEGSEFWLKVVYITPLVVIFLFYSLRWAITGKIRPLHVSSHQK